MNHKNLQLPANCAILNQEEMTYTTGGGIASDIFYALGRMFRTFYRTVVVLSARYGQTNSLLERAYQWSDEPDPAELDVLLTTGGVSVGDKDIFHQALPLLGAERIFWRVNLKPGTPAMYSVYEGKPILSLSGNPFAAFTTFELLARPLLAALAGEEMPRWGEGVLDTPFPKASPRRRFIRGQYENGHITLPEGHASGMLASLVGCNCLAELPAGSPPAEAGTRVRILLLE